MILTIVRYSSVLLVIGVCLITGISVLRKDSQFLGNRFLALATFLMTGYGASVFLTDFTPIDNKAPAALGYCLILFGLGCLFFCMQTIVKGTAWVKEKKHYLPIVIYLAVFSVIAFIWSDAIILNETETGHPTSLGTPMIPIFGIPAFYFLCYSLYVLWAYGMKKATGNRKTQMMQAFWGFLICLASFGISVFSDLYPEEALWDALFYVVLAVGIFFLGIGLGQNKKDAD